MIELWDNIPIPEPKAGTPGYVGEYTETLRKMKVGQSFYFSKENYQKADGAQARERKRSPGKQFTKRKISEDRYILWRIQ